MRKKEINFLSLVDLFCNKRLLMRIKQTSKLCDCFGLTFLSMMNFMHI